MADYNKELSKVRGPFRVRPKKKKEEPISTVDAYQKAFDVDHMDWIQGDTTGLWDDGGFKIKRNNIERIEDE